MIPENPATNVPKYGEAALYFKAPPTVDQQEGVVPLETLPAEWWNWLWNQITVQQNNEVLGITALIAEINQVLTKAGLTPDSADSTQLYQAIQSFSTKLATNTSIGVVKGDTNPGKVSVEADGSMAVNNFGTLADLSTEDKTTLVNAINSLYGRVTTLTNALGLRIDGEATTRAAADKALDDKYAAKFPITNDEIADGTIDVSKVNKDFPINPANKLADLSTPTSSEAQKKKDSGIVAVQSSIPTTATNEFSWVVPNITAVRAYVTSAVSAATLPTVGSVPYGDPSASAAYRKSAVMGYVDGLPTGQQLVTTGIRALPNTLIAPIVTVANTWIKPLYASQVYDYTLSLSTVRKVLFSANSNTTSRVRPVHSVATIPSLTMPSSGTFPSIDSDGNLVDPSAITTSIIQVPNMYTLSKWFRAIQYRTLHVAGYISTDMCVNQSNANPTPAGCTVRITARTGSDQCKNSSSEEPILVHHPIGWMVQILPVVGISPLSDVRAIWGYISFDAADFNADTGQYQHAARTVGQLVYGREASVATPAASHPIVFDPIVLNDAPYYSPRIELWLKRVDYGGYGGLYNPYRSSFAIQTAAYVILSNYNINISTKDNNNVWTMRSDYQLNYSSMNTTLSDL